MKRTLLILTTLWQSAAMAGTVVGTGNELGIYYQIAEEFCRVANEGDKALNCTVEPSSGSIENLRKLQAGQFDYALVQSDWLYQAQAGTGPYMGQAQPELRALFATHAEPFTIVVKADSPVKNLTELKGKAVDMGMPGSGTRQTALALFASQGISESALNLESVGHLGEALCSGQIAAYALVMGHPNHTILETAKRCPIRFLAIAGKERDALIKGAKFYQPSQVPARIYPGNFKPTPTFAIAATLVTKASKTEDEVYHLTKAMLKQQTKFNEQTYGYANLFHKSSNKIGPVLSIDQHPGAIKYFKEIKAIK
ncbi:MAG: TAXI family TRAP transporter solute-binding subunit [Aeromonas sp.]